MNKTTKLIIIAAVLIAAVLVFLYWDKIKAMFVKPVAEETTASKPTQTQTTQQTTTPTTKPIKAGDTVMAAKDLVKAFDNDLNAVVKTYNKGEYIGVVTKNSNGWLTVSDTNGSNLRQVQKSNVKRFN